MRDNYAAPYLDEKTWNELHKEIESVGFLSDSLLREEPKPPVYGLNIAFGWPLPPPLKEPYERLAMRLSAIDPGLYVYPYNQTHVTVMTLVNFKDHQNPSQEEVHTIQKIGDKVKSIIPPILSDLRLKPFTIDVGPPVLSSRTAFLPIFNATQEVLLLRQTLAPMLREAFLPNILVPKAVHSTILRFLASPPDVPAFVSAFESATAHFRLGQAIVNEFLLTAETKPYMIGGEIIDRFSLKE